MAKTTPNKSLVDIAKTRKPALKNKKQANFLSKLEPEQREQLLELRDKYLSGELGISWTPRSLLYEIVEPAGIHLDVTFNTWRRWIYEAAHKSKSTR
jgi:hypothetical protein